MEMFGPNSEFPVETPPVSSSLENSAMKLNHRCRQYEVKYGVLLNQLWLEYV